MAVSNPALELVIDELVLDGVAPDDPAVQQSVARALLPALESHGLADSAQQVASAVTTAVSQETGR